MNSRAHHRGLALAMRSAIRIEFAPLLARLDALTAAVEAHVRYPAVFVDRAAPGEDRTVLMRQLQSAVEGVTDSTVKVVEAAGDRLAAEATGRWKMAQDARPRHRRKVTAPAPVLAVPAPGTSPAVPRAASAAETEAAPVAPSLPPAASEVPPRSSEELMREWFAQQLQRDRLSDGEIERRMEAADTKHLIVAANARRRKMGLPPFEVPA